MSNTINSKNPTGVTGPDSGGHRRLLVLIVLIAIVIGGIIFLKYGAGTSAWLWNISRQGTWLLPLVIVSSLLDSLHPCSFSILLITIAFLFSMQMSRRKILQIGGLYIAGIFAAYFLIGLGILHVLHLFNTPHFMGKLGAGLLIGFGTLNLVNEFFPRFPLKLRLPAASHTAMGNLMERASYLAAFGLGGLVGICQFPCMGGPYVMVIGLLHDQVTYLRGFGYLLLYNFILILPLVAVLWIAADKLLIEKVKEWKRTNMSGVRLWGGLAMIALGILILYI